MTGREKRRYKRYNVAGVRGNVRFLADLKLINVSVDGAAIETSKRLDLNREYKFMIDYKGTPLEARGLVVWSQLVQGEKTKEGDVVPLYRSGVKFLDTLDEKTIELMNFIDDNRVRTPERRLGGVRCKISRPQNMTVGYPYEYLVKEISLSGMEIETEHALDPDSRHEMELKLNDKVLTITGRVVTCVKVPSEKTVKYDMGVEFVGMPADVRELLSHFIDTLEES
jgi:PilZ domain